MNIVESKGAKFYVRDHIDELTLAQNDWKDPGLGSDEVWLDVGAHIGSFACRIAPHVKRVVCIEPHPDNVEVLRKNIELNGLENVSVHELAVTADGARDEMLRVSRGSWGHSLLKTSRLPGIQVGTVGLPNVMQLTGATRVKMDCEGSEIQIIPSYDWSAVRELQIEYHFAFDKSWFKYYDILRQLEEQFVTVEAPRKRSNRWMCIIRCRGIVGNIVE